jgi:TolB-like protein/DNA-binding winged helix-turn-helix (wHTH) protein
MEVDEGYSGGHRKGNVVADLPKIIIWRQPVSLDIIIISSNRYGAVTSPLCRSTALVRSHLTFVRNAICIMLQLYGLGRPGMEQTEQQETLRSRHHGANAMLFGEFRLTEVGGNEISIPNRRAKALLAMLCLVRDEAIDRDYLSKLLWPGRFEAHAKASLRQCLLDLGKLLAPFEINMLNVTRSKIGLNVSAIQTDLDDVESALTRAQYSDAADRLISIGTSPLLDRMDFGDAFNAWLAKRRLEADHRLRAAVMDGLAALEKDGNIAGHTKLLNAWTARDPSVERSAETDVAGGRTRIAVLPFQSLDAQDGHDYFADGMVDELITTLGQVSQLMIAGRTSSFHFRNSDLVTTQIATELGVSHLIEGSVQRQGDRVRIHVHLIDGVTGFESWGDRYDGTLDNIFALQEAVAQAVTSALAAALGLEMAVPLVRNMTRSKAAYDLYLQGRALGFRLFGNGALDTAVTLLEQAVAIDPGFAEAWLMLAEVHQLIAIYTACLDRPAESAKMAACVEKALAIKPELGQAYSLLGLHQLIQNDFVGALDLAYKGYAIEPNNPQVAMRLGSYLMFCGRTEDGMKYIEEAIAQDPIDGRKYMLRCAGQLNRGDIAAAMAAGQRSVELGFASIHLAVATAAAGQHELAVEQYMQTRLLLNKSIFPPAGTTPMTPEVMDAYWLVAAKGVCSGMAEDRETYCRTLEYLHVTMHDNGDHAITLPTVFMGYTEMLFKTLGQRISPGNMGCLISIWADIDPIRQIWQHPEFIPFAQRIGMAAAWDKYGWPDLLPPPSNK